MQSVIIIAVLSALVITGFLLLTVNFSFIGKKSIHEDAKRYMTRHCLAFYPDSVEGKARAKQICKGVKDDSVYDYTLIPYGDYYLINYGGENRYFTDKNYVPVVIDNVSDYGKKIVVDYLRYTFKKDYPDKYYDSKFLKQLSVDNIDFDSVTYSIEEESVKVNVPEYEMDVYIPLKYMQKEIGMDFGFPNEMYRKPVYIDPSPDHPVICLTFDDGPQFRYEYGECTTVEIVDLLSEYDAQGTFYMIGIYLEDRDIWADYQVYTLFKKSYGNGNEFGSHTQSHANLIDLETAEEMKEEIDGPIDYMKEFMDYEMKTYRPVEGDFDETVLNVQNVPAILWDVDSEDWLTRNPDTIYHQVMKYDYETGDIILFHDAYDETIEALQKIIPELIDRGCQLLTVTDMLKCLDIDPSLISYYYGPYYYE